MASTSAQTWYVSSISIIACINALCSFSSKTVTSVDPSKKFVTLDSGSDTIHYDTLILVPGGIPRRLPLPGAKLKNVFTFRGLEDSKKVDAGMFLASQGVGM